jgi:osmotically-inducible protein OsmY
VAEPRCGEEIPNAEQVPVIHFPGRKPPRLSKPTTIIAVDVETRLAFMCGLPKSKVFFKYDSAKLLPGAKERLERIATCAKTGPAKGRALLVVGRTDPRGSDKYNEQLGKRRAESVAKYLRELGVAQTRVEIESKGEASAAKAYPGGWPYDRRVTVRLQPSNGLAAPKKHTKMTDRQITSAVAHTLLTDSALLNKQIAARVDKGIVTLSGTADHLMAKERAAKLAQGSKQDRAKDRMEVRRPNPQRCGAGSVL